MKRLLLVASLCLATLFSTAQEHLKFMGVSMNGNVALFADQLKTKGCEIFAIKEKEGIMTSKFGGDDDAILLISANNQKNVSSVSVIMEAGSIWRLVKSKYFKYKDALTLKYGKPVMEQEIFKSPYEEYDGFEITAFKTDKARYTATFSATEGIIKIALFPNGDQMALTIIYQDRINTDAQVQSEREKLMNDI